MEHKHSGSSNMFLDIVEGYIEILLTKSTFCTSKISYKLLPLICWMKKLSSWNSQFFKKKVATTKSST
jgi:hypothetical protein